MCIPPPGPFFSLNACTPPHILATSPSLTVLASPAIHVIYVFLYPSAISSFALTLPVVHQYLFFFLSLSSTSIALPDAVSSSLLFFCSVQLTFTFLSCIGIITVFFVLSINAISESTLVHIHVTLECTAVHDQVRVTPKPPTPGHTLVSCIRHPKVPFNLGVDSVAREEGTEPRSAFPSVLSIPSSLTLYARKAAEAMGHAGDTPFSVLVPVVGGPLQRCAMRE